MRGKMNIHGAIPLLASALLLAGCSSEPSSLSPPPETSSRAPSSVTSSLSPPELSQKLDDLCGANEFFPRAENPQFVIHDFDGDGMDDAVAAFVCYTEIDRLPGGYAYYVGSAGNGAPVQLLGDQTEPQGDAPWDITSISSQGSSVVVQYVDGDGDVEATFAWSGDRFTRSQSQRDVPDEQFQEPQTQEMVVVPNLIGLSNRSAEQTIRSAGLMGWVTAELGDPSLAAQANNGCVVISQSPPAGTQVEAGSSVSATAQCPQTGGWNG